MDSSSDQQFIEQVLSGHSDGYTELCRRYYPALVALAHSKLNDRHLAEDAAQEAMARAYCNLLELKELNKFGPWVAAICRNIANTWLKNRPRTAHREIIGDVAAPESNNRDYSVVKTAIDALPGKSKEILYLKYYDGMSYQQISAVLGISDQAINGRLRRAKKQLAKLLRKQALIEVRL